MRTTRTILLLILSCAMTQATTITFTGVIKTAEVFLEPSGGLMGGIGDTLGASIEFHRDGQGAIVVTDVDFAGSFGNPFLNITPELIDFSCDTFGGFGQDGEIVFHLLRATNSGTFLIGSSDPDGTGAYQRYTGDITSATVTSLPDTGSTAALLAIVCAIYLLLRRRTT